MSHGSGQRPVPPSSKEPRARFNWPPTEDDFAEFREERPQTRTPVEDAGIRSDDPPAVDASAPMDALAGFPSETPGAALPPPIPGDWDGEDLEEGTTAAASTFAIDVSPTADARDVQASADLAVEIAHLQTLIEALTRKIDWRIPGDHP